jgi:hypothetical protein
MLKGLKKRTTKKDFQHNSDVIWMAILHNTKFKRGTQGMLFLVIKS